jgi:hypothetical protein
MMMTVVVMMMMIVMNDGGDEDIDVTARVHLTKEMSLPDDLYYR